MTITPPVEIPIIDPVPPTIPPEQKYIETLLRRLWITKGIRFEAHRRLVRQHEANHLAISILSVYVICSALLELLVNTIDPIAANSATVRYFFPLATIAAPVFILVLEKHTAGKHYLVKAERMERSGLKIQALHSEVEFRVAHGAALPQNLDQIREEYELIMRDFSANHDNIDYLYFMALHPSRFGEETGFKIFKRKVRGRLAYYLDIWGVPIGLIVLPGLLILFAIISLARVQR